MTRSIKEKLKIFWGGVRCVWLDLRGAKPNKIRAVSQSSLACAFSSAVHQFFIAEYLTLMNHRSN
jgi:hypothetical protein